MKALGFTAVIWRKGKSYVSKYPELVVASCGDTFEEAIENLKEAVELYVENAKQLNLLDERRWNLMKTINVEIPEKLEAEIEKYIKGGWFTNEAELMRDALREFIYHHRPMLMEKFMEEDIEWALRVKKNLNQWK